jgi:hypothetical protein
MLDLFLPFFAILELYNTHKTEFAHWMPSLSDAYQSGLATQGHPFFLKIKHKQAVTKHARGEEAEEKLGKPKPNLWTAKRRGKRTDKPYFYT